MLNESSLTVTCSLMSRRLTNVLLTRPLTTLEGRVRTTVSRVSDDRLDLAFKAGKLRYIPWAKQSVLGIIQGRIRVRFELQDQLHLVTERGRDRVWGKMLRWVGDQAWDRIRGQLRDRVRSQSYKQVGCPACDQVCTGASDKVRECVREHVAGYLIYGVKEQAIDIGDREEGL